MEPSVIMTQGGTRGCTPGCDAPSVNRPPNPLHAGFHPGLNPGWAIYKRSSNLNTGWDPLHAGFHPGLNAGWGTYKRSNNLDTGFHPGWNLEYVCDPIAECDDPRRPTLNLGCHPGWSLVYVCDAIVECNDRGIIHGSTPGCIPMWTSTHTWTQGHGSYRSPHMVNAGFHHSGMPRSQVSNLQPGVPPRVEPCLRMRCHSGMQ